MKILMQRYAIILFFLFVLLGCGHTKATVRSSQPGQTGVATDVLSLTHSSETPGPGYCEEGAGDAESVPCPVSKDSEPPGPLDTGGDTYLPEEDNSPDAEIQEKEQGLMNTALDFYKASQEYWAEGSPDDAIEALDRAYSLIVQADTDKNPELVQQREDLRYMISKRILEIYASRHTVVRGSHNAIPLTLNKHVEEEIKRFQGIEREFFLHSYKRSGRYREMILDALKEASLPEELSWLPLIESGFKVNAFSRARALGLWQFIPSTGYKFGLKRNTWIDERLEPEKATAAAIAYLEELHQIFGDWTTVLAAYNCGEGTVLKKIRQQKISYLDNFWDLYERLPRETARYVPRFLAVLHILKDPEKYGFALDEPDKPFPGETVQVAKQVQLKDVAKKLGVTSQEMISLNPELRRKVTPGTPYTLKVPPGKGTLLLAHIDQIPRYSPPKKAYAYHRVRRGETLSLIARKYRTSIRAITRANNIRRRNLIRAGQKLKIPLGQAGRRYSASSHTLSSDGKYRVRKGDSLWLIARRFDTSTKTLQKLNNLRTARLYIGQLLKVK